MLLNVHKLKPYRKQIKQKNKQKKIDNTIIENMTSCMWLRPTLLYAYNIIKFQSSRPT